MVSKSKVNLFVKPTLFFIAFLVTYIDKKNKSYSLTGCNSGTDTTSELCNSLLLFVRV
jgi:hypothetical protein